MVRTFTGSRPPRNEMDEQEDTQLSEPGLNDFRPMPRNLFVGGAEQDQLRTRQRHPRPGNSQQERPERSIEPTRTTELEERTRVLEMAMGKILARLIPDDPLIPLLNRDAQPAVVVATRNSPTLSNIIVPTKPRGSEKLNNEPSSSKHSEELMSKNADLERQLRDVQKSIDELKSPRSHQQTLDLDNAPLNLSITAEPYQEGFKIPHLETYDGSGDPDEHLHTYQAIMRIQNANDAMMCKVFPATLKSTARRWEIKRTATELMQVHKKEGESLRDYMQRFNKVTLDIDNVPDTICLSALLHGLKRGRFLDNLLENPPKTWNEVNDRAYRGRQFNRRGQGQRTATQNQKDRKGVGYAGIPPTSGTINMISGGIHSGGQSARGRKAYARQVMTVNKNRPLKRPFEEAEWENAPITFSPADYKYLILELFPKDVTEFELAVEGVGILNGNQKMTRACYQDTFKKVELAVAPRGSFGGNMSTQPDQQTMSIADIEHQPEGVEQKAEPVEPVEIVPLNLDVPERTVKIGTKLTEEERAKFWSF
ncbi:hypothetical protein SLEP1_g2934 [Rubroshorea leprosula]|uniref:Retrotransposon gag domain-containing protein n=1 Tax=Rubroshorea leprosula TaxID=152421 RepID=A0AAV5HUL6_9ROSI|nr:hypothetical protein SLEP1_g2934 [Rubroshorea leprosula]